MFFKKIKRYSALLSGNFEEIFKDKEIPPLPEVVSKLLEAINDPEIHLEDIASIIATDAGLSTQILRVANSALYSFPGEIKSIRKAISLLGVKRIEQIAISYAVKETIKDPKRSGFDFNIFWSVSLYRAILSKEFSQKLSLGDPDEAFTGALLQDIALPVLLKDWFDVYEPVYKEWLSSDIPLHVIENKKLSWNHAQAGAWLAKRWKLPDLLVCCVGFHIEDLSKIESLNLLDTPITAVLLSSLFPVGSRRDDVEGIIEKAAKFGLSIKDLESISLSSYEILNDLANSFGIKRVAVKPFCSC